MQKWEYRRLCYSWDDERQDLIWADTKEIGVDGDTVDERLNELGREGWELISVEKISDLSHVVVSFYLKRPLESFSGSLDRSLFSDLQYKEKPAK